MPCAACCTLRAISWVAAPCSSTAAAIAEEISDRRSMVEEISLMAPTESLVAAWMPEICWPISPVGLRRLLGERLHFGGDHGEAAAGLAGARRLDGRVQRQQVGLAGDGVDQFDDVADAGRCLGQLADALGGGARLADGIARHPRRFLHLTADLADRGRHLLGRRGHRLHVGRGFLRSARDRGRQPLGAVGGRGQRRGRGLQLGRGRRHRSGRSRRSSSRIRG